MTGPVTFVIAIIALFTQFLWPRYLFYTVAGKGLNPYTALTIILLLAALWSFVVKGRLRDRAIAGITRSPIVVLLFVVLGVWQILCSVVAGRGNDALFQSILDFAYLGSWLISAAIIFADPRLRRLLPYIVAVSGIVATAFGILESQTGTQVSKMPGFSMFSTGDVYLLDTMTAAVERGGETRIRSLFTHPIVYGQVMAGMLPFALHLLFARPLRGKLLGIVLGLSCGVSILLAHSRSPLLVALVAVACFMALYLFDPRRWVRLWLGMSLIGAVLFVVPVTIGVLESFRAGQSVEEANSTTTRDTQMERGLSALQRSPMTGFGRGSAGEYAGVATQKGQTTVDNFYLSAAVESGYVGLTILLLLLLAMILQGLRAVYATAESKERSLNCAATATIAGLAVGLVVLSITDQLSIIFQMAGFLMAATGAVAVQRREQRRLAAAAMRTGTPPATA